MERFSNICLPKVFEQNFNYLNLSGAAPNMHGYLNNLFAELSLIIVVAIFSGCPPSPPRVLCTLEFVRLFKECKLREQKVKGRG
jgi:hypothetical protein